MKKLFITLFLVILSNVGYSQKKVYYNLAVNNCSETTSEGLINKCLKGSYLLNYDFKTTDGELVSTEKIKKPIVIIAASTRFAPCWALLPSLNKMIEKYGSKLEFLMILRDGQAGIDRMKKQLNKKAKLISSTKELENKAHTEAYGFVHKLDYPTVYLINKKKQFIDIKRGAAVPSKSMNWKAVNEKNTKDLETLLAPALK